MGGGTVKLCRSNTRWHFTVSTNTTSLAYFTFAGQPSRSTALPLSLSVVLPSKSLSQIKARVHTSILLNKSTETHRQGFGDSAITTRADTRTFRNDDKKKKKKTKRLRWRQAIKTVKCNEILQALVTMLSPLSNSLTSLPSFLPFFFHLFSLWSYDRLPQGLLGSIATHFSWIRIFLFAKSNLSTICMLITKGLFSILDHVLFARLASPLSL